jgi:hypothetical protein
MDESKASYWFTTKSRGIGWKVPVGWQGWVTVLLYAMSVFFISYFYNPATDFPYWIAFIATATVVFIFVVALKGDRPIKWRN